MMPGLDGLEVCRRLKGDPTLPFMPVILVTAKADSRDVVAGLDAGADEYLTKPVDQAALVSRVKSMLRIKALHDTVEEQAAALGEWNRTLESRVRQQVEQLERLGRLKRFFSPQLADAIVQGGAEDPLRTHRREVTVVFADLRGFTAFAEAAEPEEVMAVLREYHGEMGRLILAHEGTLERFTGDGLMVFFNDPIPVPDAPERAVRMAVAMRDRVAELAARWRQEGYELDLGLGIARGYATLGAIGFEGRWDYAALGTVTNLAARLCGEARPGQILVAPRVLAALDDAGGRGAARGGRPSRASSVPSPSSTSCVCGRRGRRPPGRSKVPGGFRHRAAGPRACGASVPTDRRAGSEVYWPMTHGCGMVGGRWPLRGPARRSPSGTTSGRTSPRSRARCPPPTTSTASAGSSRTFVPKLRDRVVLKTDLWDEAKNTEILRWVAEQGARPAGVDVAFDIVREARRVLAPHRPAFVVGDVRALPVPERVGRRRVLDGHDRALPGVRPGGRGRSSGC